MSYEQWAFIADLYIPLLLLAIAVLLFKRGRIVGVKALYKDLAAFVACICSVYAWMGLDMALEIWPAYDLDYSTHTALSLALACFFALGKGVWSWFVFLSFCAYCALMIYMNYHSLSDIVTTACVLFPFFFYFNQFRVIHRI